MGSRPSSIAIKTVNLLENCTKILKEYDNKLQSEIINHLLNSSPLATRAFKEYISTSREKSETNLKNKLTKKFPKSFHTVNHYLTLHISHSKSMEPIYIYINSMRSLHLLHKVKIKTLLKDFIKKKSSKKEIFQVYLSRIKGSFAFTGLCELEKLVSSLNPNIEILIKAFKQTKASRKQLESNLEDYLNSATSTKVPENFTTIRESLQKLFLKLDFPILPNNNLF